MGINGADINRARQGADDLRSQLQSANSELEGLRGNQESLTTAQNRVSELEAELNGLKAAQATAQLRARVASESGVPAYVVFSNATLQDMARKKPKNMTEFKRVSGVGELKANWYGQAFLKEIRHYLKENG
jgi:ATP-dependent DNA helicase RecQ